jgi:hypothetical protein
MSVLAKNLTSMQKGDIAGVLSTLSEGCAAYAQTQSLLPQVFSANLTFKLVSREVLSISSDEALVQEAVEVIKRDKNSAFQDNISFTQSKLTKDLSGAWKLCSTEIKSVTYLSDGTSNALSPEAQRILETMNENLQGMRAEDLSRVLSTISKRCESYQASQNGLPNVFTTYNIKYEMLMRKVLSIKKNKAWVLESITARANGGRAPFKNNQTTTQSELILDDDGQWRLCISKVEKIEYLD